MENTQYCRTCHRQRPPAHFDAHPDHYTTDDLYEDEEGAEDEAPRPVTRSAPRRSSASSQQELSKIDEYIGWGVVGIFAGGIALAIWSALRGAGGA